MIDADVKAALTKVADDAAAASAAASVIADDSVTYAKIQNVTTARLLGRATAGSGDAEEITLGTNLSFAGTTLNAAGGGAGSGITRSINITAANYSLGATALTDYVYLVAGLHTGTLPTAVGNLNRYTVKNNHSATVSLGTTGGQTIDGGATISIYSGSSVDIVSNGSNWYVV